MRSLNRLAAVVALVSSWPSLVPAQEPKPVADTAARSPEAERAGFRLPPGFEMQLVASEPAIGKPMNLAFDARGRLWVTSTVEYPFPVPDGKPGRDKVLILSDFGTDGKARKVETFADGLNIPIGALPLGTGDAALVHSIPSVRRYTDTNGDGRADRSDPAYAEFGHRDTHGMTNAFTRGFDGWIYACHGFNNDSTVQGSDGQPVTMSSGNIYRFQPDGSHAEYFSHGQVNPFGLAFDALGRLYSCDCHSRPIYQNLRGACYPSFGKADDGLGFGPEMIKHDHGSTGIGGIAFDEADHFPPEYRGSVFLGNVVTGRVHRDTITWQGSSPRAVTQPDLVTSDDPWFHPVDLEFGPDGALYIADFYNRIIGHYEVPLDHPGRDRERGRIWRVVYRGLDGKNPPPTDPRPDAPTASTTDLIADLGHPNMVVRLRATELLVRRGEAAAAGLTAVLGRSTSWQRAHALWVLHRVGKLDDSQLAAQAEHADEAVRVHAARIWGDRETLGDAGLVALGTGLRDASPHVRRAAAESLGMHPGIAAIRPLLDLLAGTPIADDHLRHVGRIALRDSLRDDATWDKLTLSPSDEAAVADVAPGLPTSGAARFVLDYLVRHPDRLEQSDRLVRHAARYGAGDPQPALVDLIRGSQSPLPSRARWLSAIAQANQERGATLNPVTLALGTEVATELLDSVDAKLKGQAVNLAGTLNLTMLANRIALVAADRATPTATRTAALATFVQLDPGGSVATLDVRLLDASEAPEIRDQAAKLLGSSGREDARAALVLAMNRVPSRLQTTIAATLASSRPGASALLDAVAAGKASARPLGERSVAVKLQSSGVPDLTARLAGLLKDAPPADGRIQAVINDRRLDYDRNHGGDTKLGAAVFAKNCAACHQIEGQGARVGPQLDGIGVRGLERLLEDVMDPNRNVDQAFRATTLGLKDGRVLIGLLARQDGAVLVLVDAEGKEVAVPVDAVEERKTTPMSPMPANFADTVDPADFRHLMSYLLSKRPADVPSSKE